MNNSPSCGGCGAGARRPPAPTGRRLQAGAYRQAPTGRRLQAGAYRQAPTGRRLGGAPLARQAGPHP